MFIIKGCDNVKAALIKVAAIYSNSQRGLKVMMRSKKRNMIMMKYDYHPLIIVTSTPLEHENDEKYKVKVHSRQRSLLSHSVNFIWTLVLLNEYTVCLFTLD